MSDWRKRPPLPPSRLSKDEAEITGEESHRGVIEKRQRQEEDAGERRPRAIDLNKIPDEEEGDAGKEVISPRSRAIDQNKLPEEAEEGAGEENPNEGIDLTQKQEQEQEEEVAGEENLIEAIDPNPKQQQEEEGDVGQENPIEAIDPNPKQQHEEEVGEVTIDQNKEQEEEAKEETIDQNKELQGEEEVGEENPMEALDMNQNQEGEAVKEGNSNEAIQNTQNQESMPETVFDFLSNMITQDEADAMNLSTTPLMTDDLSLCTYYQQKQHTTNY